MMGRSSSRAFCVICLESFSSGWKKSGGRMTAAQYTGPASGPRPASSQPASSLPASQYAFKFGFTGTKIHIFLPSSSF